MRVDKSRQGLITETTDLTDRDFLITRSSAIAVIADRTACKSTIG